MGAHDVSSISTFGRILCPIDFSEFSRHALDQAVAIGHCYGSVVTALHVLPFIPYGDPMVAPTVFTEEDLEKARRALGNFASSEAGRTIESHVVQGEIVSAIVDEATRTGVNLIVMGTHGRGGFERLILGSVTERLLRKAPCPVWTVPRKMPDVVTTGPAPASRILCCTDYSPASDRAVEYAAALARRCRASLTLINVVEAMSVFEPMALEANMSVGEDLRRESAARLHAVASVLDVPVSEFVVSGSPYRTILQHAEEERSDLIVIGVHSGFAERFHLGSTANQVVRAAGCAVLTVR